MANTVNFEIKSYSNYNKNGKFKEFISCLYNQASAGSLAPGHLVHVRHTLGRGPWVRIHIVYLQPSGANMVVFYSQQTVLHTDGHMCSLKHPLDVSNMLKLSNIFKYVSSQWWFWGEQFDNDKYLPSFQLPRTAQQVTFSLTEKRVHCSGSFSRHTTPSFPCPQSSAFVVPSVLQLT